MIGTSQLINTFSRPCFTDTTDIFKDGSGVALYGLDYDASDAGGTSGKFGEAAIFNGTSSKIDTGLALNTSNAFSYSLWFNTSSYSSGAINMMVDTTSNTNPYPGCGIGHVNGQVAGFIAGSTGNLTYNGGFLTLNQWHHTVLTHDGSGNFKLYLDGVETGTGSISSNLNSGQNILIGNSVVSTWPGHNGKIDQVRIYNTALTQSQVTQLSQENSSTVGTHLFGCIANYNLDGSAKESMGTTAYDGVETDITYRYDSVPTAVDFGVGGKSNYGARFNGSSSKIALPSLGGGFTGSSSRSVSAWVKITSTPTASITIFNSGSAATLQSFGYFIGTSRQVIISYYNRNWETSETISLDTWNHILFTYNGGAVETSSNSKIYINGTPATLGSTTGGATGSINTPDTNHNIGFYGPTNPLYFNGSIDQVRIFSKALSSDEVSKLYGNGAGEIACAYTSTTDNIALPITNTAYYKLDNSSKDSARSTGKFNEGAIFNGSSSKIESNILQSTNMTFSFWFQTETVGEREYLMGFNTSGSAGYINTRLNANDTIGIVYWNGSTYAAVSSSAITRDTNYNHICITISGTSYSIYYNGNSLGSGALSGFSASSRTDFVMGFDTPSGSGGYMNGSLDQVRLFNVALSSADVSNLYAETASDTNTLSFPSGQTAIATYQLDGNSTDLSGNHNGTDTNITYAYDGTESNIEYRFGKFGQAAVFDGYNSYIEASNVSELNGATAVSVSLWFNWDDSGSVTAYGHMVNIGAGNNAAGDAFGIAIGNDGGSYNRVLYGYFPNGSLSTGQTVTADEWHHTVIVYEGTSVKYYYDGSLIATQTRTSLSLPSSNNDIVIGHYAFNGNHHFKGQIDQVRIYSTALDSDQVSQLYNEKPEVDTSNFKAVLYEGTSANQYISQVGFDLDVNNDGDGGLVWIKNRDQPDHHVLFDSVRGASKYILSSSTTAESPSDPLTLSSFEKNGFFLGTDATTGGAVNGNNESLVAWVWKGGGAAVPNTQGDITSDVSANTEAGFSIVKYTGNTGVDQTVGTGLTTPCDIVIVKRLTDSGYSWCVGGSVVGDGKNLYLDTRGERLTRDRIKSVQSETFTVNQVHEVNNTGKDYIAYCFHSVAGYSRISTYEGDGSNDNKIYTTDDGTSTGSNGFKPSFVMLKNVDTGNTGWLIHDTARDPVNTSYHTILANANAVEYTSQSYWLMDFESDGFRLKYGADNEFNKLNDTYIYMAFK